MFDSDYFDDDEYGDDEYDDDEYDDDEEDMLFLFSDLLNNISNNIDPQRILEVFGHIRYREFPLQLYSPGIFESYENEEGKSSSKKQSKFIEDFNTYDIHTQLGYFLLLSFEKHDLSIFQLNYTKFLKYFVEDPKLTFNKFITSKYIKKTNNTIIIKDKRIKEYLETYYIDYTIDQRDNVNNSELIAVEPTMNIVSLMNHFINIFNSNKAIFTKKGELTKSVLKLISQTLNIYLPRSFNKDHYNFVIQLVLEMIFICEFITITDKRSIKIQQIYYKFLTKSENDKFSYITKKYTNYLYTGQYYSISQDPSLNKIYRVDNISKQIFGTITIQLASETGNFRNILISEIIFNHHKFRLETSNDNEFYDFNKFKLFNSSYLEFRPSINPLNSGIYYNFMEYYLILINFNLNITGICTPLINKNTKKIIAYRINDYSNTQKNNKKKEKIDLIVLADLTIKAESSSLSEEEIQWLVDYTQIITMDNYIESRIDKDKLWNYLESHPNKNVDAFIQYLNNKSKIPVPANVIEIVKGWGSQFGFIQFIDGVSISIPIPEIIDQMLALKSFSKINIVRASKTLIIVPRNQISKFKKYLNKKKYHIISNEL